MSSADYNKMMEGVRDFLRVMSAKEECKGDKFSIVLYGATAELAEHQAPINKPFTPPKQFQDGRSYGTDFNKAFQLALREITVAG